MENSDKKIALYMMMPLIGNIIFGFSFVFSKLAMDIAQPSVLLSIRFICAWLILSTLRWTKLIKIELKGKDIRPLILLGFIQPIAYFVCETYGLKLTSSLVAGILISLVPIGGVILGRIFLKEKPTLLQIIFSIISVLGVIIMTYNSQSEGSSFFGIILLLGSVLAASSFSIVSRKINNSFSPFEKTYVMFSIGAVFYTCLAIIDVGSEINLWLTPLTNPKFWLSIFYLAGLSSVAAFILLNKALEVLDIARYSVFVNVSTIVTVLAGVFILKEPLTKIQAIGMIMSIVGVYGVNKYTNH